MTKRITVEWIGLCPDCMTVRATSGDCKYIFGATLDGQLSRCSDGAPGVQMATVSSGVVGNYRYLSTRRAKEIAPALQVALSAKLRSAPRRSAQRRLAQRRLASRL